MATRRGVPGSGSRANRSAPSRPAPRGGTGAADPSPSRKRAPGKRTRTAFVTGATGFIGINLIDALVAAGWEVTALHRPTSDLKQLAKRPVARAVGNIVEPATLSGLVPEGADAVFHCAADLNVWSRGNELQYLINVEGTRNVVAAALAAGARRFVHTSSVSAWGLIDGRIDETVKQRGWDSWINYQRTKWLAEEEVREGIGKGLDAVILNPCQVVGAYDVHGWGRMIRMVDAGTLPGVPPGSGSFAHVGAVARAHIAAAEKGGTGENYLLGGADHSYAEFVATIARILGRRKRRFVVPAPLLMLSARLGAFRALFTGREPTVTPEGARLAIRRQFADCSKAVRELGYEIVPLDDMVHECIDWLRRGALIAPPS